MKENSPALYCFKFNTETSEWIRFEITEYRVSERGFRTIYSFTNPRINKADRHYSVPDDKIDRFVNYKIFTFYDDLERAKEIALKTIDDKIMMLDNQVTNAIEVYKKLRDSE